MNSKNSLKLNKSVHLRRSVIIFAHSRAGLLNDCITSVLNAYESDVWKKVIVLQIGYPDVEEVVEKYKSNFDIVLRIKKHYEITLGNINLNRIIGTSICFDSLASDVVLGIEEDTMISYDSLYFITQMCQKFKTNKSFRGVNLGSFEPNTLENRYSYSVLRYGLHGQAGAITRKTWNHFKLSELLEDICTIGWDSKIESYLKTGFLPTPNASRLLDRGFGGTHQSSDPNSPYFANQRNSWVGSGPIPIQDFTKNYITHSWRKDARNYKKYESFVYRAKDNKFAYGIFKYLRKSLRKNKVVYSIVRYLKILFKLNKS
jgi:hypothetical protein